MLRISVHFCSVCFVFGSYSIWCFLGILGLQFIIYYPFLKIQPLFPQIFLPLHFFFCFSSVILIMLLLLRLWKSPHSSWMFSFCCFFFNLFFSFYFVLWSLNCPIIKLANPPLTHLCLLMSPLKAFLIYVALFLISSISWTLRTSVPLLTLPSTLACSWRFTLKSVTY